MDDHALNDDGLETPTVGDWAEEKYRLVACYAHVFARSMKLKWDERVYVDLFSGSGRALIRGTNRIVETSAMRVLSVPDPFDRYIFCDRDEPKLSSLRSRVVRAHPDVDARFIEGDSNATVERILSSIPRGSFNRKVLTFCLADPYKLANLNFQTIQRIAERYVDFLVLIPTGMDANRNLENYSREGSRVVGDFIGRYDWRETWSHERELRFGDFVASEFGRSMEALGYKFHGLREMHLMRNTKKRSPIYRLAMFSRS
jgi:three-Cys-motif partner protein